MQTLHCVIFILNVVKVYCQVLPDYFPQCKRSDPQIEKCIIDAVGTLKSRLKDGIPEVNIPIMEPFAVPSLKIDKTVSSLKFKADIKNMTVYGAQNFTIEKLNLNLNKTYAAEMKLILPRLSFTADYDVHGSISMFILTTQISGKGRMQANFTGITMIAKGVSKVILKDDEEYLKAKYVVADVNIDDGYVSFDDAQNPVAGATATKLFNTSPSMILKIFNPIINDAGAAIYKAFFDKILGTIPLSEVLPII